MTGQPDQISIDMRQWVVGHPEPRAMLDVKPSAEILNEVADAIHGRKLPKLSEKEAEFSDILGITAKVVESLHGFFASNDQTRSRISTLVLDPGYQKTVLDSVGASESANDQQVAQLLRTFLNGNPTWGEQMKGVSPVVDGKTLIATMTIFGVAARMIGTTYLQREKFNAALYTPLEGEEKIRKDLMTSISTLMGLR